MSHILFINPLLNTIKYYIFDMSKQIVEVGEVIGYDISISLPQKINELAKKYTLSEIWCIEGPGAFTKMRITTLTLNTLKYTHNIISKGCHFFDLLQFISPDTTPIIEANKNEFLIQNKNTPIFYQKDLLPNGKYIGYIGENTLSKKISFTPYSHNTELLFSFFESLPQKKRFSPIYIKSPHITCPKK